MDNVDKLKEVIVAIKKEVQLRKSFIDAHGLTDEYNKFQEKVYGNEFVVTPMNEEEIQSHEYKITDINLGQAIKKKMEMQNGVIYHNKPSRMFYMEFDQERNAIIVYGIDFRSNQVIELPSELAAAAWCRVLDLSNPAVSKEEYSQLVGQGVKGIGHVYMLQNTEKVTNQGALNVPNYLGYDSNTGEVQPFQDISGVMEWCNSNTIKTEQKELNKEAMYILNNKTQVKRERSM